MSKYFIGHGIGCLGYLVCKVSNNPIISGNIGDVFLSGGIYSGLRASLSRPMAALVSTGLASLAEMGQFMDIVPGTPDFKDFLAYGCGVAIAYSIDKIMSRKGTKNLDSLVEESS